MYFFKLFKHCYRFEFRITTDILLASVKSINLLSIFMTSVNKLQFACRFTTHIICCNQQVVSIYHLYNKKISKGKPVE